MALKAIFLLASRTEETSREFSCVGPKSAKLHRLCKSIFLVAVNTVLSWLHTVSIVKWSFTARLMQGTENGAAIAANLNDAP